MISVQNLSFDRGEPLEVAPPTLVDQARKSLNDYSSAVRYGVLLALFLMVYLLTIRPIQKRVLSGPNPMLAASRTPARPEPELAPVTESHGTLAQRSTILKKQLAEFVRSEPDSSTTAVRAWLREDAP